MNIEERLNKIEWQVAYATSGTMNEEDRLNLAGIAEDEVPALATALRAVLYLCDSTPLRYRPYDGADPFMVLGVPAIRSAIETALTGEV